MECTNCGKMTVGGATCPWCKVLLTNAGAGVLATPGRRLGAYMLELVLAAVVAGVAATLLTSGVVGVPALLIILFVIIHLYFMAVGTSLGKRLLGMRVYRLSGRRAGFFTMLIRETIGKSISGMLMSLGFLWLLWDKDVQGWHDKLMGTVVLWEKDGEA